MADLDQLRAFALAPPSINGINPTLITRLYALFMRDSLDYFPCPKIGFYSSTSGSRCISLSDLSSLAYVVGGFTWKDILLTAREY